jgi:hypothetical protein
MTRSPSAARSHPAAFAWLNSAVLHLASLAETGTTVSVVSSLPKKKSVRRLRRRRLRRRNPALRVPSRQP